MSENTERFLLVNPDGSQYGPADLATLRSWAADGRVPLGAMLRPVDGGAEIAAASHPILAEHLTVPPIAGQAPPLVGVTPSSSANPLSSIIPTRNPPALIGYYLGVFGLIPCLGFPLAVGALVCGIIGLVQAKKHPESKGKAHAITAIVLGSLVVVASVAFAVVMGMGVLA